MASASIRHDEREDRRSSAKRQTGIRKQNSGIEIGNAKIGIEKSSLILLGNRTCCAVSPEVRR